MIKNNPPSINLTMNPESLDVLSKTIEDNILQKITHSPEKFFPSKKFNLKIYSSSEAASILRVSDPTVRKLCNDGKIGHMRPSGRNIMISQEQLDEYLETIKVNKNAE